MLGTGLVRLNLVWDGLQFGDSGYNALRTLVDGLGNLLQQTSVFAVEMTATASQAEQILEAVAKAAEAASLREANEQSRAQRSGFSEASKVVKTPNAFGCANSGEDQAHWLDFSFSFKQWLFYAEPGYEAISNMLKIT